MVNRDRYGLQGRTQPHSSHRKGRWRGFIQGDSQMDEEVVAYSRPERLFRAVVRIWDGRPDQGGAFLGTAFFVAPRQALTAAHGVRGVDPQRLFVHLSWRGGFYARVVRVEFAEGSVDAALL